MPCGNMSSVISRRPRSILFGTGSNRVTDHYVSLLRNLRLQRVAGTNSHANGSKAICLPSPGVKMTFYFYKDHLGVGRVSLLAGLSKGFSDHLAKRALTWCHVQSVGRFPLHIHSILPTGPVLQSMSVTNDSEKFMRQSGEL